MPSKAPSNGTVHLKSPAGEVAGYLAKPKRAAGPGVLVLPAWWGLNDFFKRFCDRLATKGFVAFALDYYHGATASTREEAMKLQSEFEERNTAVLRADVLKSFQGLQLLSNLRGKPLGIVGFSMGVYWGLWLAQERPREVAAVVMFYGNGEGNLGKSQTAFLGHFAENDEWVPANSVRQLESSLRANGHDVAMHVYPGTTHWFFEADRPDAYKANAADLAWERTAQFLAAHLGRPEP